MKITVIGGGIIGLACAWRLAQRGARVQLRERNRCGQGATAASLGALWPPSSLSRGPLQELHRRSLWKFEAFLEEIRTASRLPVSFRRSGRVEVMNSEKAAARARDESAAARLEWPKFGNEPVMETIPPEEARRRWPHVNTGEFGVQYCRATGMVRVNELIAALQQACIFAGVDIRENMPVEMVSRASLECDAVLITAGAWSGRLAPVPVRPAKGQGIAVASVRPLPEGPIIKSAKTYLVPWPQETLVGSTTEPEAGFDDTPTPDAAGMLLESARNLVPALAGAAPIRHWAGLRPDAPHHMPILGPLPGEDGVFACTGHYKTGIGMASTVGNLMAAAILDRDLAPLAPFLPSKQKS